VGSLGASEGGAVGITEKKTLPFHCERSARHLLYGPRHCAYAGIQNSRMFLEVSMSPGFWHSMEAVDARFSSNFNIKDGDKYVTWSF